MVCRSQDRETSEPQEEREVAGAPRSVPRRPASEQENGGNGCGGRAVTDHQAQGA